MVVTAQVAPAEERGAVRVARVEVHEVEEGGADELGGFLEARRDAWTAWHPIGSLVLTLVVVPTLYSLLDSAKEGARRLARSASVPSTETQKLKIGT